MAGDEHWSVVDSLKTRLPTFRFASPTEERLFLHRLQTKMCEKGSPAVHARAL